MPAENLTKKNPLEKKLYQLIISRLEGERIRVSSYQEKILKLVEKGIGGFIIFGGKQEEVKSFIHRIQSISEIMLFIASDVERGIGQQIQDSTVFPCQMAVSAAIQRDKPENVVILRNVLKAIADEANDVGINMPLIPVLDVNRDPDNPIICTRAFSDNPEDVSWFGSEYIRGLEGSGLISCAKHFPGHGDTSADSHIRLPVIKKSYENLINTDMMPFKNAINAGVSSIMIGHLSVPVIDSKPASLSKKIITGILRKALEFKGIIVTDALTMNALKDIGNVPLQCLKAGADVLLHPIDPDLTVREILSAIKSKEITEELIEEAFNRILSIKKKIRPFEVEKVDYQAHRILSSQVTDMSISIFKNTHGVLPISDRNRVQVICAGEHELFHLSVLKKRFKNISMIRDRIELGDKIIMFLIFTSVAAWKGSSGIDGYEKSRIQRLIKRAKHSVVVSFGSPYVLRHFNGADMLIAAYEATEQAQEAVMKCLEGRMDFKGRLPVKIGL